MHKSKNQTLLLIYLSVAPIGLIFSQSAIATSSNDITTESGSISYSVGQIAYSEVNGANFSIIEGVQQPYEITIVSSNVDYVNDQKIDIYPNPVTESLIIETKLGQGRQSYVLRGVDGRIYLRDDIYSALEVVPMSELIPGTYFLMITQPNRKPIHFKILKH